MDNLNAAMDNITAAFNPPSHPRTAAAATSSNDKTTTAFVNHSTAPRVNTDVVVTAALKKQYPKLHLSVAIAITCPLLRYAAAGHATYSILDETSPDAISSLQWHMYIPPARRIDGASGFVAEQLMYGKMLYRWRGYEFVIYYADGRDGSQPYPNVQNFYILSTEVGRAEALMLEAGKWGAILHDEVWVFDRGFWQKNRELWESIRNASWDNVILEEKMKKDIIDDHLSFFNSRETYKKLKVPWKRGLIYYGPPGNGKTISIKAMMHMLYSREDPVPTLYVRTLASFMGPEGALKMVFDMARQQAPCYLVFEDLDTIITPQVRSYFFNEVDGLKNNDGIFMIGSTNHLETLDPGIAKRPSRFDRKYLFPDPVLAERVEYCHFWQGKLAENPDVDFPDELCDAIAKITDKFSFAYMQEAFVAALLAIARKKGEKEGKTRVSVELTDDMGEGWLGVRGRAEDGLDDNVLWIEIQAQIKNLRENMDDQSLKYPAKVVEGEWAGI